MGIIKRGLLVLLGIERSDTKYVVSMQVIVFQQRDNGENDIQMS